MRIRMGQLKVGRPPTLIIEAETSDDRMVLDAISDDHGFRLSLACVTSHSGVSGVVEISLGWVEKVQPAVEVPYGG